LRQWLYSHAVIDGIGGIKNDLLTFGKTLLHFDGLTVVVFDFDLG
jgi:hypothetical protein